MYFESMVPSNHFILCRLLLLLPSIPFSIRVFSNELVLCIRWPEYWSFSFSISPSNEYSGLISFRIDCFDLAVQENLKSLLLRVFSCSQFESINSSGLSLLYGPIPISIHDYWKTIALTICQPAAAAAKLLQSCLTLCDPMNCSMPGLPVHHQLPEFTQTHVHRVSDAI